MALLEFGFGDLVSTYLGFSHGIHESQPVAQAILASGGFELMIIWKIAIIAMCFGLYWIAPADWKIGVPIGLFVVGLVVVSWNVIDVTRMWREFASIAHLMKWMMHQLPL